MAAILYSLVATSGYALFGSSTEGDVLKSLTISFVETLVPRPAAHMLIYGVAFSYTFNLLVNFVLKVRRGGGGGWSGGALCAWAK